MAFPESLDFLVRYKLTSLGLRQPLAYRRTRLVIEMHYWRIFTSHREQRDGERVLIFSGKLANLGNRLFKQLCHHGRQYTISLCCTHGGAIPDCALTLKNIENYCGA